MPRVRTRSTTYLALLSLALLGVAAAAAAGAPSAETAPQAEPFIIDQVTPAPVASPAESTGAPGLEEKAVTPSALCPLPEFFETAFSRRPTCAEAEAKCTSKALAKVVCNPPEEVCQGPDVFIDSCKQKPAGDFRADCHVVWRCSLTP